MNDQFLHQHRRAPSPEFGAALYQQLLDDAVPVPRVTEPPKRPQRWLRLVAAVLVVVAAGVVTLESLNPAAPSRLTQIDTGLLLDELPPITVQNAGSLMQVARIGSGRAHGIAYAPDGSSAAVGTASGVSLFDGSFAGEPRLLRTTHDSYIRPVAYSPDGSLIATLDGGAVRIWESTSGAQKALLETAAVNLMTLAFSPDGTMIAAGGGTSGSTSATFELYLWDVQTQRLIAGLDIPDNPVVSLAFSPALDLIAIQTTRATFLYDLRLHSRATLDELDTNDYSTGLAFSPDGSTIAVAHQSEIIVWTTAFHDIAQRISIGDAQLRNPQAISYSPDGSRLAISTQSYGLLLWDVEAHDFIIPPGAVDLYQDVSAPAFSPDSSRLATIYGGTTLVIFDTHTGEEIDRREMWEGSSIGVALSPDNRTVASSGFDNVIRLRDLQTGKTTLRIDTDASHIFGVGFTPDGERLAYMSWRYGTSSDAQTILTGDARLVDLAAPDQVVQIGYRREAFYTFTLTSDRIVAYASGDGRLVYWDIDQPDERHNLIPIYVPTITNLTISPDGSHLAGFSPGTPSRILLYDLISGKGIDFPVVTDMTPETLAFSPDGLQLAMGGIDIGTRRALSIWDIATQTEQFRHTLEDGISVTSIVFSPDGNLVAAGGNALALLDAADGTPLYESVPGAIMLDQIRFSSDGRFIIGGGWDGFVRVWGAPPEDTPRAAFTGAGCAEADRRAAC